MLGKHSSSCGAVLITGEMPYRGQSIWLSKPLDKLNSSSLSTLYEGQSLLNSWLKELDQEQQNKSTEYQKTYKESPVVEFYT